MLADCNTLEDYLTSYGSVIGKQAQEALKPLHVPGRDPVFPFTRMKRRPFEAQSHAMTATVKALKRDRVMFMACKQGTGKSLMSCGVADELFAGKPYRAIVMCPPHLTAKWEREIRKTLTGVRVIQLRNVEQLMHVDRTEKPDCAEWWIVKENSAKSGADWRPAVLTNHVGAAVCPNCMKLVADKNGVPLAVEVLEDKMMDHEFSVGDGDATPGCYNPLARTDEEKRSGAKKRASGDSHLWSYCRSEYNTASWAIAKYARTHLKRYFDILIVDEVHENRSETSARATAMGQLSAASKKCLGLTGTFAGGYAWQLRSLLMRLAPQSLLSEGFTWENVTKFNEVYGRIETKITKDAPGGGRDNRKSQGKTTTRKTVRPGIMPTLFGRHLIDKCVFMDLDELSDSLPSIHEQAIPVEMDSECRKEYARIEKLLKEAIVHLLAKGNRQLLGAMLRVLLTYPDHPYGFDPISYMERGVDETGFFEREIEVVTPADLSPLTVRAKQQAVVDAAVAEVEAGRQVWIYVQDTNKYDVQPRLKQLLEARGLTVKILRSNTVKTEDREEWIEENGVGTNVIISHPQLVQTGLDLFNMEIGYNFPTLIFWQTGYELYVLRQAAARAWRIGQEFDCKVLYFYYADTMQERAMNLMGRKLVAAEAIEGKFTAEGLAAMTGEDETMEVAMAKALIKKIDDCDVVRSWGRFSVQSKKSGMPGNTNGKSAKHPDDFEFVTDDGIVITKRPEIKRVMRTLFGK